MTLSLLTTICLLPLLTVISCKQDSPPPDPAPSDPQPSTQSLSTETLTLAGVDHVVELAYTDESRRLGLMYRDSMPANTGMLFIFNRSMPLTFHMQNCLMDIDIVYIRASGQIDSIMTMQPPPPGQPSQLYHSRSAVKYALELPAGQAKRLKLKPGDIIPIPRRVRRIQAEP